MNERTMAQPQKRAILTFRPIRGSTLQGRCACGQHTIAGSKCAECRQRSLQRRRTNRSELSTVPPIVREVLCSPSRPLDTTARGFVESRFGHDFSQVRVHTDPWAAESARAVNALAYTVGRHVVFGAGQYAPGTVAGKRLLTHELAHVVQQSGSQVGVQAQSVISADHPSEREADRAAEAVMAGQEVTMQLKAVPKSLQRAKGDLVKYSGGPSGTLSVVQGGKQIFSTSAVSGHPGSKEFERNVGPIPTGTYTLHPQVTRSKVTRLQSGVCGANAISSGYQEITSNDQSPCSDPPSHYCTVNCPTAANPSRKCFTPRDCWGEKRIKIEGSVRVPKPTGGRVTRSGFYIHGGNHTVTVTSGCIKVFDNAAFTHIRKLKGAMPLCVGSACPAPTLGQTIGNVLRGIGSAARSGFEALGNLF